MNLMSSGVFIPLSQIKGFLWVFNNFESSIDVFNEVFKVFRFLLFIPIRAFSNDAAISASFSEWTSTTVDRSKSLAAWYKSFAISLSTADKIINMQSAPKLFARGTWYVSIKKSLHSIGILYFFLIFRISSSLPKKKIFFS